MSSTSWTRTPFDIKALPRDAPIPIYLDLDSERDDPDHALLARYLRQQSAYLDSIRTSIVGPILDLDPASAHERYQRDPTFMRWTPEQAGDMVRLTWTMDNLAVVITIIAERRRVVRKLEELERAVRGLTHAVAGASP